MALGGVPAQRVTAALPSRWAWVLQDALGVAFCLYMLKTIRLPTFKVRVPRMWAHWLGGGVCRWDRAVGGRRPWPSLGSVVWVPPSLLLPLTWRPCQ